jgi:hypothetical protein
MSRKKSKLEYRVDLWIIYWVGLAEPNKIKAKSFPLESLLLFTA